MFSIVFIDLVIQGGSLGLIVTFLLGIKFDIILRRISVNVLACQFVSGFPLRTSDQGKLDIERRINVILALSKCYIFLSKEGRDGIWNSCDNTLFDGDRDWQGTVACHFQLHNWVGQ